MTHGAPKQVSILGSTGSVGANTVEIIEMHNARKPGSYQAVALTAHDNVALLAEQARRLKPAFVAIGNADKYADADSDRHTYQFTNEHCDGYTESDAN